MDETQRLAAVAALDEAIEQVERAQTPADMRAAAADVLDAMETSIGGGGIIHMVLGRFRERLTARASEMDPDQARAEMLPQLRQWRDQIASGADIPGLPSSPPVTPTPAPQPVREPVRNPENRPTRPGCTGGAALLVTLTLALAWALAACR